MAEDHLGQRQETKVPWTKLFTAFKVALDVRKLLLAAAGIFAMNFGWVLLSWVFFNTRSEPKVNDYLQGAKDDKETQSRFKDFQVRNKQWNLLNELAGNESKRFGPGDLAANLHDYQKMEKWNRSIQLGKELVKIDTTPQVKFEGLAESYTLEPAIKDDSASLDKIKDRTFRVLDVELINDKDLIAIGGVTVKIPNQVGFEKIKSYIKEAATEARILEEIAAEKDAAKKDQTMKTFLVFRDYVLAPKKTKPYGRLGTWVWAENRGANPYLLATSMFKHEETEGQRSVPWEKGHFFSWLFGDQFRVLVEPLDKVLTPLVYLFSPNASGWNRIYLILVLLWTLLVWGFFGGAITRMAVVQIARNEKISLREAIAFAKQKCVSYFCAPVFPLILLAVLTLFLIVLGVIEGHTYFLGDLLSIIIWPIALLLGLIMAVVLVGLIGWPLMNPTISAEGSDSFDALSRSYSYVYQAPWHYLWYSFLALVYGAALVFFVGLMGSLMVFMGKWGLSQAPFLSSNDEARDREPTYLFVNAPTSFGWRDLLIHDSQFAEKKEITTSGGVPSFTYNMSDRYTKELSWHNRLGSWMVALWLGLVFLLVVGFGYSYFWTASTIIYLLMRKVVDDTEIDEIHIEEDMQPSFSPETPPPSPGPAAKPGTVGLTMVEPPATRPPEPPTMAAPTPPPSNPPAT